MLELVSYGLTGLVAILLVAFCFACNGESASFIERPLTGPMYDAKSRHSKPVERCTGATNDDTRQQGQKDEGALRG
jgi:hypothetical protein